MPVSGPPPPVDENVLKLCGGTPTLCDPLNELPAVHAHHPAVGGGVGHKGAVTDVAALKPGVGHVHVARRHMDAIAIAQEVAARKVVVVVLCK